VKVDIAIVGSGMAGAAAACFAAPHARVAILEREPKPGLHSTGRSAAMLEESCGPSPVRALTRASRAFFEQPGAGFAEAPLLRPRGALFIAAADRLAPLRALHATLRGEGLAAQWLGTDRALGRRLAPAHAGRRGGGGARGERRRGLGRRTRRPRSWPASRSSPGADRPWSSTRPRTWMCATGRWWWISTKASTSSPRPACCWARRPTPTRCRRMT
jgi:hypothetical protein